MRLAVFTYIIIPAIIFCSGYMWGSKHRVIDSMQSQLDFYDKERKLRNDIQSMSDYNICLALGGMRNTCRILKRQSSHNSTDKVK